MRNEDRDARTRRELVRRATLYSLGFIAAGVGIALGGAALIAWLLTRSGLPFLRTWLILVAIVVLPGLVAAIFNTLRGR
jgi:hypothetical protein